MRQGISHYVQAPRAGLHSEISPKELADSLVLGHNGEALLQHVLEGVVIGVHDDAESPQIGSPFADGLHKLDELAFIGSDLDM